MPKTENLDKLEEYEILSSILDIHSTSIPRFADIGYKHHTMPQGLTIWEYDDYMDFELPACKIDYTWRKKPHNDMTSIDWKEFDNMSARFQTILYLEDIPQNEWTENEQELLEYVISDVDFFSSKRQFREIFEKRCNPRQLFLFGDDFLKFVFVDD